MADVERITGPDLTDWWEADPPPEVPDAYTPAQGEEALAVLGDALASVADVMAAVDANLAPATRALADRLNVADLVATVDLIQWFRRRLGVAEAWVAREVGMLTAAEAASEKAGTLPDGRPYEVLRGANRKAWKHDQWQHDVRQTVIASLVPPTEGTVLLVNGTTGEPLDADLSDLLAKVEAVHGSTAPRVTALKALGLSADDYCESSPGPYTVKITAPSTTGEIA
jgi:hypothetical protein